MMRRNATLAAVCFALLWLNGCSDGPYRDFMYPAQTVNGQSYIVIWTLPALDPGSRGTFRIHRCVSPDFSTWQPLDDKRPGPVYGTFVYRDQAGEQLGLFHEKRASLWRFDQSEAKIDTLVLPADWIAETGAQLEENLYLFGGDMDEKQGRETGIWKGRLSVALYDGKAFSVLEPGPVFTAGKDGSFSLQAVAHKDKIHVFWRCVQANESLDLEPTLSFTGPLLMATFDGLAFEQEVREFADLPKGHVEVWSDGQTLHAVVQPQEATSGRTPQPRLFTLDLDGKAREESMVPFQAPMSLHFKYFNITRLNADGRTAFLRSNSQEFEVWEPASGRWTMRPEPTGLPRQEMMFLLLSLLFLCVGLVAMGVGMAIRRRRQMHWVLERLRPQDVLAPLSLRISAYLMDVGVVIALTLGFCALTGLQAPRWSQFFFGLDVVPSYVGVYLVYFTLAEWRLGRTPGKWLLGLQVVTDQGEPLTLWSAFVRNLVGFFERHIAPAAVIAVLMTPRAQRVGDLMGRSLVVQRVAFARYREQRQRADAEKAQAVEKARSDEPDDPPAAAPDEESSTSNGDTKA